MSKNSMQQQNKKTSFVQGKTKAEIAFEAAEQERIQKIRIERQKQLDKKAFREGLRTWGVVGAVFIYILIGVLIKDMQNGLVREIQKLEKEIAVTKIANDALRAEIVRVTAQSVISEQVAEEGIMYRAENIYAIPEE